MGVLGIDFSFKRFDEKGPREAMRKLLQEHENYFVNWEKVNI